MPEHTPLPPFSGWVGPRRPKALLVGEAFGRDEDMTRRPFSGAAGKELWRMLGQAFPDIWPEEHSRVTDLHRYGLAWIGHRESWLNSAGLAFTNVLNLRPPDNKIPALCQRKSSLPANYPSLPAISRALYLSPEYLPELDRLQQEISESQPNLVVCLGNTAIWALLQSTSISAIRGTTVQSRWAGPTIKVLPTFHPASVLYDGMWNQRAIIIGDLTKAAFECNFPEIKRPQRKILISPTLDEVQRWTEEVLKSPPQWLSCDIETSGGIIDTIGFGRSHTGDEWADALVIPLGPHRIRRGMHYEIIWPIRNGTQVQSYWTKSEEPIIWHHIFQLLESPIPKLGQNFIYDLQYILRMGIKPNNCIEDTMLLHHALFPEMRKNLGFLASLYTNESAWKIMRGQADTEKRDE